MLPRGVLGLDFGLLTLLALYLALLGILGLDLGRLGLLALQFGFPKSGLGPAGCLGPGFLKLPTPELGFQVNLISKVATRLLALWSGRTLR